MRMCKVISIILNILTDGDGYIEIATTRPETMLGDTAIVVNPNDDRYKDVIGKKVILPIVGRELPILMMSMLILILVVVRR